MAAAAENSEPEEVAHYGRYDLRGLTVGDLRVERPVSRGEGKGVVWEAFCACGAPQLRTTSQLALSRDMNAKPLCPRCLAERREAMGYERRDRRIEAFYKAIWRMNPAILESPEKTRSALAGLLDRYGLYGVDHDENEAKALRREFSRAFEVSEPTAAAAAPSLEPDEAAEPGLRAVGPDWSALYPMAAPRGHVLDCRACGKGERRGWGCVECIEFYCYRCLTGDGHTCGRGREPLEALTSMSLAAIGRVIGVQRERVRQIEGRVLRELRARFTAREKNARAVCAQAAARIWKQLPHPAHEEAVWAERVRLADAALQRFQDEQRAKEERRVRDEAAHQREEQREQKRREEDEDFLRASREPVGDLVWAINRVQTLARGEELPWHLRYPPSKAAQAFEFGGDVLRLRSLVGLVSCVTCRKILVAGTPEADVHARGYYCSGKR